MGVAAFNKRQAEEIQLLLDNARRDDPVVDRSIADADGQEPLFIKNLENVQGDERDVMLISTTYGPPNPGERVAQRFGPINSDVGWRRLNVIATRAKQRVEVFSSMRPTDVLVGDSVRRGPRSLRDYLDYAESGRVKEHGRATGAAPDSEFEVAVGAVLEQIGYEWEPQVGVAGFFIDIGVRHPDRLGEYLVGIECDGAAYHSSKSVRDRDRLRQEILESKGWCIHRIWSTSWFHTRSAEIDRLRALLEAELRADRERRPIVAEPAQDAPRLEAIAPSGSENLEKEKEEKELDQSLEAALERFWSVNIRPMFPGRDQSILSKRMIRLLAAEKPTSKTAWYKAIPVDWRSSVNASEMSFLDDVLEVVEEYV